jgi:hypothetical protein
MSGWSSINTGTNGSQPPSGFDIRRWLMAEWIRQHCRYRIISLGAEDPEDLCSITEDELKGMGLKPMQIRRFFMRSQDEAQVFRKEMGQKKISRELEILKKSKADGLVTEAQFMTMVEDLRQQFNEHDEHI